MIKLILVLSSIFVCACSHTTVTREETLTVPPTRDYTVDFWLWTFIPGGRRLPPENEMCPQGRVETLDFGMDSGDAWVSVATLGIYVQETVRIGCSARAPVQKN